MRAVFDTNVVVSALVFGRRLAWLRHAWVVGQAIPIVCRPTIDELLRVLGYPKFRLSAEERQILLQDYLPFAEIIHLPDPLPALAEACRDRDDAIFLQLALVAGADALVSGDADLGVLRGTTATPVLSAAAFRIMLNGDPSSRATVADPQA
jgi:putative PIN family toxin of toxin-antitoxin system